MGVKYKIDVLKALKEAGYNTTRLRDEKLLSQSTIQYLREGKPITLENLSKICLMLGCQLSDVMEVVEG